MQPVFGYRVHWMGLHFRDRRLRTLEYVIKSVATIWLLVVHRPSVTWLQLPPTPLLYVAFIARTLRLTRVIVTDCHHSILWEPWIKSPFLMPIFRDSVEVAVFHSQTVIEQALQAGFDERRCCLLEDRPAVASGIDVGSRNDARPQALFPASFDADEPIEALVAAARRMPGVEFVFTGDASRAQGIHDLATLPQNVVLMGWVSTYEYKRLLVESDVIISLTTQEGIQTSAAGEAVGNGKAMVLSDTNTLRTLYPKGAVYTRPDADRLEVSIRRALDNQQELEKESRQLRTEREQRWRAQARCVIDALGGVDRPHKAYGDSAG
jgi:glycosyltransferase involved in cell wall biosynthesis